MFCVLPAPTRHTGFAVDGSPVVKFPLLQLLNVPPDTAPAVSCSDCVADAPPGIAVPFPPLVAVIDPVVEAPVQLVVPKSRYDTGAVPTPTDFTFTLPSVNVVVATPDASPVAVTS